MTFLIYELDHHGGVNNQKIHGLDSVLDLSYLVVGAPRRARAQTSSLAKCGNT